MGIELHTETAHVHNESEGHGHAEGESSMRTAMVGVAGGFFLLLGVEHLLTLLGFNHTHAPSHRDHDDHEDPAATPDTPVSISFVLVALAGLGVHSFVDGLVLAGAFRASASIGLRVAVAIIVHKFPDGFVLSSLISSAAAATGAAGPPAQRKLYTAVGAVLLMTPLGALIGGLALTDIAPAVLAFVLGFGAGTFLFLSATAIIPEVLHSKPNRPADLLWIAAGYLIFVFLESLTPAHAH